MATLNFPDAPDTGDIYFDSNSGFTYEWNGTVWISRDPSTIPNIKELDNISGSFNGSTATFNLTVSSVAVTPATAQQLLINIGNVLQNPGDDYTVSGSTITFTTAPISGLGFQGTLLGTGVSLGTVVDGTVDPSSLDISDSYNVGGITVTGITTVTDFSFSGITTVANLEPADMDISGIGTVSNIIMTKDAAGLGATMGAAVGVVTYFGDGSNLTGLGLTFFPISYDPGISSTTIPIGTNITLDWNHPIKAGSGTITIRTGSASGTVVDQFVVGTSSSISFVNNQVILDPAADLANNTEHFVVYPTGTIKSFSDKYQNDQLIYSFTTEPLIREVWVWGASYGGSLGLNEGGPGSGAAKSSPVQLPGTTWGQIGDGYLHMKAVKTDGTLWSWGYNDYGQMGLNNSNSPGQNGISSPTQIGTDTTWSTNFKHYAGSGAVHFIKTDGTLWNWGQNYQGTSAFNKTEAELAGYSSPTQIGTETTWSDISGSSNYRHFAIKTDGTLWSWGYNIYGTLGLNTSGAGYYRYSSPTQVGTDTTWSKISSNGPSNSALGLKTDNTLWAWGINNFGGQLGLNQPVNTHQSSPTQIPGTNWSDISLGVYNTAYASLATKTDGTLWMWGANQAGCLGQNESPATTTRRSSPVQVGTGTDWAKVQFGQKSPLGVKTDGTLWSWGYNNFGGLANNDVGPGNIHQSSPIQIPGTNWLSDGFRANAFNKFVMKSG